jgi:hypothetical protein
MNPRAPGSRDDGCVGPRARLGRQGKVGWMKQVVLIVIGGLIALTGAVWTLQGLGYVSGSFMTGATLWAIIGPVVLLAGLAILVAGLRRRRRVR